MKVREYLEITTTILQWYFDVTYVRCYQLADTGRNDLIISTKEIITILQFYFKTGNLSTCRGRIVTQLQIVFQSYGKNEYNFDNNLCRLSNASWVSSK